jgi:hypothetical protein
MTSLIVVALDVRFSGVFATTAPSRPGNSRKTLEISGETHRISGETSARH